MIEKYIIRLQRKGYTRVQIEEEVLKLEIEYPTLSKETLYRMVFENLRYEINIKIILIGLTKQKRYFKVFHSLKKNYFIVKH